LRCLLDTLHSSQMNLPSLVKKSFTGRKHLLSLLKQIYPQQQLIFLRE
jgi:hypothetical protein